MSHTFPFWQPDLATMPDTHLWQFMQIIRKKHLPRCKTYTDLHHWSITNVACFWSEVNNYFHLFPPTHPERTLLPATHPHPLYQRTWFPDIRFNFAKWMLHRATIHPDDIAIKSYCETGYNGYYTYGQLQDCVLRMASALQTIGVRPRDRIAGLLPNTPEAIISMLATTYLGAIWSACPPECGIQGLIDRFAQITPSVLITVTQYQYQGKQYDMEKKYRAVIRAIPSCTHCIIVKQTPQPTTSHLPYKSSTPIQQYDWDAFLSLSPPLSLQEAPQFSFSHPMYILYSSGTTGRPKCIVHSAGGTALQHSKELGLHVNLHHKDRFFYQTSTGWMMWNWMVSSLTQGVTLIVYDGSPFVTPTHLWDIVEKEHITVFGTSAAYLSTAEKRAVTLKHSHNLRHLRTILSTGSVLYAQQFDYVRQHIHDTVALCSISGGTDIIGCFALANPLLPIYRGELPCIALGMDVVISNPDTGQACARGETGELCCGTPFPSAPLYFWNDAPDGTAYFNAYFERYPTRWAHGDYATLTDRQTLIITGRADTTLNPKGIRIGTAEVYRVLAHMPPVQDSLIVEKTTDPNAGLILFVVLTPSLSLTATLCQQIRDTLRQQAGPYHVPKHIFSVTALPYTYNCKKVEKIVQCIANGDPIKYLHALSNPECLPEFKSQLDQLCRDGGQ